MGWSITAIISQWTEHRIKRCNFLCSAWVLGGCARERIIAVLIAYRIGIKILAANIANQIVAVGDKYPCVYKIRVIAAYVTGHHRIFDMRVATLVINTAAYTCAGVAAQATITTITTHSDHTRVVTTIASASIAATIPTTTTATDTLPTSPVGYNAVMIQC